MHKEKQDSCVRHIPRGIWILGFVSLLMDVSSEMIHSLLPLFMVTTLGASTLLVGIIEGLAEATALIVKVFSGMLSDYIGKRKWLAVIGYGLGAFTKPIFAMSTSLGWVLTARLTDRVGKGIRGAPRDALIADITPPEIRGAAFGLRQALDTVGAFIGPLLATSLMLLWADNFRHIFWVAVIPGLLAVLLLIAGIREPESHSHKKRTNPLVMANLRLLGQRYWWIVILGAIFTLARFSEAFLVLRANDSGIPLAWIPLVMVLMNIVYSLSAYPFGKMSDRMSRYRLLTGGMISLIVADLLLAVDGHWTIFFIGIAFWGLHMGMTQGILSALIADTAPEELRGTAFGFFNLVSGIAMLLASIIAGLLWDFVGASSTFMAGAVFSLLTLILLYSRKQPTT